MAVYNSGSNPHRQNFYGKSDKKPDKVYTGDKFTATDTLEEFLYDGEDWILYNRIIIPESGLPINLVCGVATDDGEIEDDVGTIIDDTKDFSNTTIFDGKIVKIRMDDKDYFRLIVSTDDNIIGIEPIAPSAEAFVVLGGDQDETYKGVVEISVIDKKAEGNNYSIKIIAGEGDATEASISFDNGLITIISATETNENPIPINTSTIKTLIEEDNDISKIFSVKVSNDGTIDFIESPISFEGGSDGVVVKAGSTYVIMN